MSRWRILTLGVCLAVSACARPPRAAGPLAHEAYIWQRVWSPAVSQAIARSQESVTAFVPLAAEVGWQGTSLVIARPAIDFAPLKSSGRPVGLALRIGSYRGPFRKDDAPAAGLASLARSITEDAKRAGVSVCELQIDFDSAESQLGGYRLWVAAIREAVRPVPISITALPSWLGTREFGALAREAGSFVLQVHSVEKPTSPDAVMKLCDPARAQKWVEAAAKVGVTFRVALPTYSVLVAFDSVGKFSGISAEGPLAAWPREVRLRVLRADARELAALVQRWIADRPANFTGVIWYRLPISSDTMNWRWPTLAAIIAGRTPRSSLRVEASDAVPSDVAIVNDGELDEPVPRAIDAAWDGARLVASDALEGFTFENGADAQPSASEDRRLEARAIFRAAPELESARLSPGERRVIGWLRLDPPRRIHVAIRPN